MFDGPVRFENAGDANCVSIENKKLKGAYCGQRKTNYAVKGDCSKLQRKGPTHKLQLGAQI